MTSTTMNIPKEIVVGYNERSDTYTKKLAYVIYIDEKGKLRKENSWQSWRNKHLGKDQFTNEPTEGFVLNKGVGGVRRSYSWNARNEYVRVFDPRGFEFEISVNNLLFILQECTSIKGKGLEGEFVYSWSGKELVLLPVGSEEYKECQRYTENLSKKLTRADMIVGSLYRMKNAREYIYMGHEPYHEIDTCYSTGATKCTLKGKKHIFMDPERGRIQVESGYTKLAERLSEEPHQKFAEYYDQYMRSIHGSPKLSIKYRKVSDKKKVPARYSRQCFLHNELGTYNLVCIENNDKVSTDNKRMYNFDTLKTNVKLSISEDGMELESGPTLRNRSYGYSYYNTGPHRLHRDIISKEDLCAMELYSPELTNNKDYKSEILY